MCEFDLIPIGQLFPQTGNYLQIRNTTLTALSSFLLLPFLLSIHCGKANISDIAIYYAEPEQQDTAS